MVLKFIGIDSCRIFFSYLIMAPDPAIKLKNFAVSMAHVPYVN